MMQQIIKGTKTFTIDENALTIPYGVRRKLRVPKNMQAMGQSRIVDNEANITLQPQNVQNKEIAVPYEMSQAFIKYMLFYRIVAYLIALSLLLSIVSVYGSMQEQILILANNAITLSILAANIIKLKLYAYYIISKKQQIDTLSIFNIVLQLTLLVPHPTIWTHDQNPLLHLFLMLRVFIIFKFLIQSSVYFNVRAYRIINLNGLNAAQHFLFAVKSLVQSLSFLQILMIELLSVMFFTHCLYLVGMSDGSLLNVVDCFEIIIVTMPTVGFGEYELPFFKQKIIIFFTVVFGAVLNSFVTLSMLSQLQMNEAQLSSYWLFKKINTREAIENISKSYIQKSFTRIREKRDPSRNESKKHINFSFRNEYRLRKSLYNSISYTDINNLFAFYRDSLIEFKAKCLLTSNMVAVLLRSLHRYNFVCEDQEEGIGKNGHN